MSKKKSDLGLIIKLLVAIAVGLLIGYFASTKSGEGESLGFAIMQFIGSVKHILGQIIFFTIPLIITGFIAPSITRLGANASKMLFTVVIIAYTSSVLASLFATLVGFVLVPVLTVADSAQGGLALPKLMFELNIPAVMPVMSALVLALMIGTAALVTKAELFKNLLDEYEKIVVMLVHKVVLPILPFFILGTFAQISYEGGIKKLLTFLLIILVAIVGHLVWIALLYGIGGVMSKRNPWEVLRHYGPAYLTAVGTMSSAATLPVALSCARKSKVLSRDIVDFSIPMGNAMHLCGSVLTETLFCITIIYISTGALPSFGTMFLFAILLGIFAVGAPGVPGGTVMASLGIVVAVLGFNDAMVGMLLAIFALQDSFGTACNVTGDGGIALMMEGIFNPDAENLQTGE